MKSSKFKLNCIYPQYIGILCRYSCENNLQLLKHELNHSNKEIMPFHEQKEFLKNDIKHHCSSLLFQ